MTGDEESDDKSRTFVFTDEGHTLGNVLRAVITSYPEVTFCGYTVPHPAETKMHFRIQTNGPKAIEMLMRGLKDIVKICDMTLTKFDEAMDNFKSEKLTVKEPSEVKIEKSELSEEMETMSVSDSST